jgi:hypothetical protein
MTLFTLGYPSAACSGAGQPALNVPASLAGRKDWIVALISRGQRLLGGTG